MRLIDDVAKEILYVLEDGKRVSIRGLAQLIMRKMDSSYNAVKRRVESMLEDGYIDEKRVYGVREISITDMGKEIIKCLRCVDEIKKRYEKDVAVERKQ